MKDTEKLARIFKILSVERRIRIIELLKRQPLCVNALAHFLGITQAAVSQHLRIMRDAEIVVGEKRGYFIHYRVNEGRLAEFSETARKVFEGDD